MVWRFFTAVFCASGVRPQAGACTMGAFALGGRTA